MKRNLTLLLAPLLALTLTVPAIAKGGASNAKSTTYRGVVKSIQVAKKGNIQEVYLMPAGSSRSVVIRGCGAMSAQHRLLFWAFENRRLVNIHTSKGCISYVNAAN